jgi:hypothetical protein
MSKRTELNVNVGHSIKLNERGGVMECNATFNNMSVLLVEGIRENNRSAASHWQTLLHNVVLSTPRLSGDRH